MITGAYCLMTASPETSAHLVLLSTQDLGQINLQIANQSVPATADAIPSRSEFLYHFRVGNLIPATVYPFAVDGQFEQGDFKPIKTLPGALPPNGLKAIAVSDLHTEFPTVSLPGGLMEPSEVAVFAAERPDFLLSVGDNTFTNAFSYSTSNGAPWIRWVRDYLPEFHPDHLIPVFAVPGNHDVGNGVWDGSGSVNKGGTYFRVFFPAIAEIEPTGANHGTVSIGDYLQIVGIDSHSATVSETAEWISTGVIDTESPLVVAIHHCPMFGNDVRQAGDVTLAAGLRDAAFRALYSAGNVPFTFCGHLHTRARTFPLGIVETDPGGDRLTLSDGGFIQVQETGIVEIGQGYRNERETFVSFLQDASENMVKNFNVLEISKGKVAVRTSDDSAQTLWSGNSDTPRARRIQPVLSDGSLSTAVNANGSPVYPVAADP